MYKTFAIDEFALGARHEIRDVRYSLEGDIIYASSQEGLLMYEASTGKFIRKDNRLYGIKSFCLTFDGMNLLLRRGQTIKVCDAMTTEIINSLELPHQTQAQFLSLQEYLLGFSKYGAMQIWNLNSGDLVGENECHSASISCCDVAPTLDRVISCDIRGETILTNLDKKKVVRRIFTDTVLCCKFSPDGRFFAIGDSKGGLSLWDGYSGELLWGTQAHTDAITGCAFLLRDNRLVLTGSADGTLKAWAVDTKQEVGFMNFEEEIRGIASSSRDSQITVALAHRIAVINAECSKENHQPNFVIGEGQCILL